MQGSHDTQIYRSLSVDLTSLALDILQLTEEVVSYVETDAIVKLQKVHSQLVWPFSSRYRLKISSACSLLFMKTVSPSTYRNSKISHIILLIAIYGR